MRRESLVAVEALAADELAARMGAAPAHTTRTLVRRQGTPHFVMLRTGQSLAPGDEVVFYEFDPASDADLAAVNAAFNSEYYASGFDPPWPDETRVIQEFIPASGARVLESCCGAGRLAWALVRAGNRVTALDASLACVRHARARDTRRVQFVGGDALHLPFADGAFEVACIFENSLGVLFGHQTRALDELVRVARTRVILGFREDGAWPDLHIYYSLDGYLELAHTFTMASVTALLDGVSARDRIARRIFRGGDERPWGGREFFVILELR